VSARPAHAGPVAHNYPKNGLDKRFRCCGYPLGGGSGGGGRGSTDDREVLLPVGAEGRCDAEDDAEDDGEANVGAVGPPVELLGLFRALLPHATTDAANPTASAATADRRRF
jgi:hypothetical protein